MVRLALESVTLSGKACLQKASSIILQLSGLVCDSIEIWDVAAN